MLERLITIVAGTAILSGILVLLGWFAMPVRILVLAGAAIMTLTLILRGSPEASSGLRLASISQRRSWRGWIRHAQTDAPRRSIILLFGITMLALAAIIVLVVSGTTAPIRSPWSQVPDAFFVLYAILVGAALFAGWTHPRIGAIGVALALGITALVAILVYPLGFGFDHFLHVAAQRIILDTGALAPPPFFYSAHYGLATLIATLGIPLALADRLLVPLLTVVILVPLAHRTLPRGGVLALLVVPFLPLAVSTPQALSFVFGLAAVLSLRGARPRATRQSRPFPGLLRPNQSVGTRNDTAISLIAALASFLANPLSGIPIIASVIALILFRHRQRILGTLAALGGIFALPIAFALTTRIVPQLDLHVAFSLDPLRNLVPAIHNTLTFHAADFATADALAIARIALPLLWIALAIIGWRLAPRSRVSMILPPCVALGAALAVFLTVSIPTQLAEEQTDFPLRLLQLAALLAVPLAGTVLHTIVVRSRTLSLRAAWTVGLATLATLTLLLAYPRNDAQARSGLWSVSADDIAAVHAIANDAGNEPYVVLANQMLGAAAIRELGFRPAHILDDGREVLAFPLPAGGPIAREFWNYVTAVTPDPAPIHAAMSLVNATRAYIVLHDYWTNYTNLVEATVAIADGEINPQTPNRAPAFFHLRVFRFDANP
ncbi:MAG: hypothetical protein Q7S96_04645 [bacterium]|nr:hypothetical protein [bacterium]